MENLVCSMWNSLEVQYSPIQLKRTENFPCSLVVRCDTLQHFIVYRYVHT
ncbi:hypothetical protein Hanom_Chr14g01273851 [Helianthus anomalus]